MTLASFLLRPSEASRPIVPNTPEIIIRPATRKDMDFVMSSWKKSWRTSPWAGCIRNDEYYSSIASTIEGLVLRGAAFYIACLDSRPDRILGWVCSEQLSAGEACIHYLYVKDPYIKWPIGKKLIEHVPGKKPGFYTFRYRQVAEACHYEQGWRHAPEIARRR